MLYPFVNDVHPGCPVEAYSNWTRMALGVRFSPFHEVIPVCPTWPTVCPWARPTSASRNLMMICSALNRFPAISRLLPQPKVLTFKLDSFWGARSPDPRRYISDFEHHRASQIALGSFAHRGGDLIWCLLSVQEIRSGTLLDKGTDSLGAYPLSETSSRSDRKITLVLRKCTLRRYRWG